MKQLNFRRLAATATLVVPCSLFAIDTDGDGLDDSVETDTGVYVSPANTGTAPNDPDSDGDGAGDWYEVVTIDVAPTDPQPNAPNEPALKPNIPYPLPAPDSNPPAADRPVKVYILSGQSNMVGQGEINPQGTAGTLSTITRDENKFPNLLDGAGWSIRSDVKYRGVIAAAGNAGLTPGQGSNSGTIGPELGFGHVMGYHHDEPVLVIKASEGGRALGWDFLPPGSVDYTVGSTTYAGFGSSPSSWPAGTTPVPDSLYGGYQFDQCFRAKADWAPAGATIPAVDNVTTVLDNFDTEYPQWAAQGFEIAGFAWFQGWNDGLSFTSFYANRYEQNMAQFIRQIRSYYETRYPGKIQPQAPFVIATAAFEGWDESYLNQYPTRRTVLDAQHAISTDAVTYPDFVDNVKTMEARGYWRDKSISPSPGGGQGFHYNRNAETFMLVGDALGRGMIDLLASAGPDTNPPAISGSNPLNNATDIAANANLVLTFNESIAANTGSITLKNLTDSTQTTIAIIDDSQVTINGSILTINPTSDLADNKTYAIQLAATAIEDLSGNPFPGIADDTTWRFTTEVPDVTAPGILSLNPVDDAIGVATGTNLRLTFDEPIVLGTGNVIIKNLSNSTQTSIAVTNAARVSLSGSVLTINPASDLAGTSDYAIQFDAGTVEDLSNNPFAGISDDTPWNFTTAAPPSNTEITIVNEVEGFLGSDKTQVTTVHNGSSQIDYDANAVSKLVVAIASESGFNNNKVNSLSVSFNGTPMILAAQENTIFDSNPSSGAPGDFDGGIAAVFYLDDPFQGVGKFTVGATTTGGGPNGGHVSIIGLSGTAEGVGNTSVDWYTQTSSGNVSTSLETSASNSLVVAMVENSGRNNGAGTPTALSPLTLSQNGFWGSQWGSAASGHQAVTASGTTVTPTFNTNAGGNIHVVGVEFLAEEIAFSPYDAWTLQYPEADLSDPTIDFDGGGLPTGVEWVVGGNPTLSSDDAGLAPSIDATSDPDGKFLFTFRRSETANSDSNTTIAVEYGSTLTGWTTATHEGTGSDQITITETPGDPGFSDVTVALPGTLAVSGRLFVRLSILVATP